MFRLGLKMQKMINLWKMLQYRVSSSCRSFLQKWDQLHHLAVSFLYKDGRVRAPCSTLSPQAAFIGGNKSSILLILYPREWRFVTQIDPPNELTSRKISNNKYSIIIIHFHNVEVPLTIILQQFIPPPNMSSQMQRQNVEYNNNWSLALVSGSWMASWTHICM